LAVYNNAFLIDAAAWLYHRYYQDLATGVLSECYSSDQSKATMLVVHQMTNYGSVTPLQLAVRNNNQEFVAHPVCQTVLTTIWHGRLQIDDTLCSYLKVSSCSSWLATIDINFH